MARVSAQTLRVLAVLLEDPMAQHYGLELCAAADLASGVIYPMLARLERIGWIASEWEDNDPVAMGRPRRRYYRLTAEGARAGREELSRTQEQISRALRGPLPRSLRTA